MYILFYLALLAICLMPKLSEKKKVLLMAVLSGVIIVTRYGVGTDYFSYQFLYERLDLSNFSLTDRIEPGFKLLMYVFKGLNLQYHVFSVFVSGLIYGLTVLWIYRNSDYPSKSMFLYSTMFFFVWTLSALRQGLVMSIGLLLFFDKRIQMKNSVKFLIIIGLSAFHLSALILIPLILISEMNLSKINLIIIFLSSILIGSLPIGKIIETLSFIPRVSSILYYVDSNPILSFPNMVRLILAIGVFIHYDRIIEKYNDSYSIKIVNTVLIGFAMFFLFRFSETSASRFSIYTFLLTVLVFPLILSLYLNMKQVKYLALLGFYLFGSMFYFKELNTMEYQADLLNEYDRFPFTTYWNKDDYVFDARFYYLNEQYKGCNLEYSYESIEEKRIISKFDPDLTYLSVKDPKTEKYGILNSDGNWLEEPKYNYNPKIIGSVMQNVKLAETFFHKNYIDLSGKNRSEKEIKKELVKQYEEALEYESHHESLVDISSEDLNSILEPILIPSDTLKNIKVVSFDIPVRYYIIEFEYYGSISFLYLDDNFNPITDYVSSTKKKFNDSDILIIGTQCGDLFFNSKFEVIWFEN